MATAKKTRKIEVIEFRHKGEAAQKRDVSQVATVTASELKAADDTKLNLAFNLLAGTVAVEVSEAAKVRGGLRKLGLTDDWTINALGYLVTLKPAEIRKAWAWHCSKSETIRQPSPQTLAKAHKAMLKAKEQPETESSETEATETEATETESTETGSKVKAKTATFADRFLKAWIALDAKTQTKPELVSLYDLAIDAGWSDN